jgi:hypothetical protein
MGLFLKLVCLLVLLFFCVGLSDSPRVDQCVIRLQLLGFNMLDPHFEKLLDDTLATGAADR